MFSQQCIDLRATHDHQYGKCSARMKAQQAWEHTDGLLTQQSRRILYFKSELASKTSASVFSDYHYRSLFGLNNFLRSGTKWTACTSCCAVAPVIGSICIHVHIIDDNHNQNNPCLLDSNSAAFVQWCAHADFDYYYDGSCEWICLSMDAPTTWLFDDTHRDCQNKCTVYLMYRTAIP